MTITKKVIRTATKLAKGTVIRRDGMKPEDRRIHMFLINLRIETSVLNVKRIWLMLWDTFVCHQIVRAVEVRHVEAKEKEAGCM